MNHLLQKIGRWLFGEKILGYMQEHLAQSQISKLYPSRTCEVPSRIRTERQDDQYQDIYRLRLSACEMGSQGKVEAWSSLILIQTCHPTCFYLSLCNDPGIRKFEPRTAVKVTISTEVSSCMFPPLLGLPFQSAYRDISHVTALSIYKRSRLHLYILVRPSTTVIRP